jgi:WD40 repeat protein
VIINLKSIFYYIHMDRLFSCGTSKDGESFIVEWNESEGAVKRTYQGFHKRSLGVVQFDTTKNRYLAAGDDFSIKFWDMDTIQLLTAIDADGGLQVCKQIPRFSLGTECFHLQPSWLSMFCRQVHGSDLTRKALSWLFPQMTI